MILSFLPVFCVGIAIVGVFIARRRRNIPRKKLLKDGLRAKARVLASHRLGKARGDVVDYLLTLRVLPKNDRSFSVVIRHRMDVRGGISVVPGSNLTVRYLMTRTKEPSVIVESLEAIVTREDLTQIMERSVILFKRLHRVDVPAKAKVHDFVPTSATLADAELARVYLTVFPDGGEPFGSCLVGFFAPEVIASYARGREIGIRYDPLARREVVIDQRTPHPSGEIELSTVDGDGGTLMSATA